MKSARPRRFEQHRDVRLYCARGAQLPQAKLSDAAVADIRRRYKPFCPRNGGTALAREFGVHPNTILEVTNRESWAHVRTPENATD